MNEISDRGSDDSQNETTESDLGCLQRRHDSNFRPHFIGYRSTFVDIDNNVVVVLREPHGRVDAETIASLPEGSRLTRDAVTVVADAMCHAANVGVPAELLRDMASSMAELMHRTPFCYAQNVTPLGMYSRRGADVSYVLGVYERDEVMIISPDIRTDVIHPAELKAYLDPEEDTG